MKEKGGHEEERKIWRIKEDMKEKGLYVGGLYEGQRRI
jgi:hypothetical protein